MIKQKRAHFCPSLKSAAVLAVSLCIFTVFSLFSFINVKSEAFRATDVFSADAEVQLESAFSAVEKLDNGKKGVLLKTEKNGAKARLATDVSGEFSACFRVFSDEDFKGDLASYTADPFRNEYLDLITLRVRISDVISGEFFDVVLSGGEPANCSMTSVRVEKGNSVVGYYYEQDAVAVAMNSSQKNSVLRYTLLGGTSFSNVTYFNGALTEQTKPIEIRFDPQTMSVYGIHYGYNTVSEGAERLIADISDEKYFMQNDVAKSDFLHYSVSFIFDSIQVGKTAKLLVYEINGQTLDADVLEDVSGAQISAAYKRNYTLGENVPLPKPYTYDLVEKEAKIVEVCVKDEKGQNVSLSNGSSDFSAYSEDLYFRPAQTGEYSVIYRAFDSNGRQGKECTVKVNIVIEDGEVFILNENYPDVVGTNTSVYLEPARVESLLFDEAQTASIEVDLPDGTSRGADADTLFHFESAGEYIIRYTAFGGRWVREYAVTVQDGLIGYRLSEPVPSELAMGDYLEIPDCTMTYLGKSYSAESVLIAPDGKVTASKNVALNERGIYKLIYAANAEGLMISKHYEVESVFTNDLLFTAKNGATLTANVQSSELVYGYNGVMLSSANSGASAVYNSVIDLSEKTASDTLLEVLIDPSEKGKNDFGGFTITLTDIYDESNRVTIEVKAFSNPAYSVTKAAATGQVLTGRYKNVPNTRSDRGYVSFHSFSGEGAIGYESMRISFDYADRAVHVSNPLYTQFSDCVVDLDDVNDFSGATWSGFTTGECRMEIVVNSVSVDTVAKMILLNVDGEDLSGPYTQDFTPPELVIDTQGYLAERLPEAQVGTAYPLFSAKAYDRVDGEIEDLQISVYENYKTAEQREIPVVENSFIPEMAAEYTVVYVAKDFSGNIKTAKFIVSAKDKLQEMELLLSELPEAFYSVGEVYEVPDFSVEGGSGNKTVKVILIKDGETLAEGVKNYFFEQEGNYILRYLITDYLGTESVFDYSLNVTFSEKPIVGNVILPAYLIDGFKYEFPELSAYKYSEQGETVAEYDIFVDIGGEETKLGTDRIFVPEVESSGDEMNVRYVAYGFNDNNAVIEQKIKVLKATDTEGNLNMADLFVVEEGDAKWEADRNSLLLKTSQELKLQYYNAVLVSQFGIMFDVPEYANAYEKLDIVLTDSADKDVSVRISVYRNAADTTSCLLSINGGTEKYSVIGSFYDNVNQSFYIGYDHYNFALKDESSLSEICRIAKTEKGETFAGFPSGKVYIDIELCGVNGESALQLLQINNQVFGSRTSDIIAPQILLNGNIKLECDIGETVEIPTAAAADVIQSYVDLRVVVIDPSKNKIIDERADRNTLRFTGSEYGVYTVIYTATDGADRSASLTYSVYIRDKIAPTLEITGKFSESGKVGKTYNLPAATASDNVTQNLKIYIFCISPNGGFYPVEGDSYVFESEGKYTFRYFVKDENYNYVYKDINVEVKR